MTELMAKILKDPELHRDIIATLVAYRQRVNNFRTSSNIKDMWDTGYKMYKNMENIYANKEDWQADILLPYVLQYVETIVPRLVNAIYSVYPLFEVSAVYGERRDSADKIGRYLNATLMTNDFFENITYSIKSCLMYGTDILKYVTKREFGKVTIIPEHQDIYSVGIDPDAKNIDGAEYIYSDTFKPYSYLVKCQDEGIYFDVERIIKAGSSSASPVVPPDLQRLGEIGMAPLEYKTTRTMITEWYLTMKEPSTGKYEEILITTANDQWIIRAEPNPFGCMPYERMVLIPTQDEFYGVSIPQMIHKLVYEANEKRNQVLDANNIMINPVYAVIHGSIIGESKYKDIGMEPGEFITVSMDGAITPIQQNFQALNAGYQDLLITDQSIKDAVGVQDFNRGAPKAGEQTATEIVSLINEGNMRFLMMIHWLEHNTLLNIAKKILKFKKMFMPPIESYKTVRTDYSDPGEPRIIREFEQISRDKIPEYYDIQCMAAAAYNMRAIESQNTLQFVQMIQSDPDTTQFVDKEQMYKMVARALNIKDISFFKKKPDLPPTLTPEQMQTMLNKGGAGAGVPAGGGNPLTALMGGT